MSRDLLDPEEVVTGRVLLRDLSRRNVAVVADREGRDGLFLKMARDAVDASRIAQEAAVLRHLAGTDAAGVVPRLLHDEPGAGLLVTTAPRGGRDLSSAEGPAGPSRTAVAGLLGEALATVHRATAGYGGDAEAAPPWALAIHRPTTAALGVQTPASLEMIAVLQSEDRACEALDELRSSWRPACLVHGDVKHENVLVTGTADPAEGVMLVDWEHAAPGEPLWDVASAVAALLGQWVHAIDLRRARTVLEMERAGEAARGEAVDAVSALWRSYVAARGRPAGDEAVRDLIRLAGARLLLRANEATQSGAEFARHVALHVQLGVNLLSRPEAHRAAIGLE